MLRHPLLLVLVLTVPLWAQSRRAKARDYELAMAQARERLIEVLNGEADPAVPLHRHLVRIHELLGQAVRVDSERPEAYLTRGMFLCDAAVAMSRHLEEESVRARTRGISDERIQQATQLGLRERARYLGGNAAIGAHAEFQRAIHAYKRQGTLHPHFVDFISAVLKYAGREFEQAKRGEPGAIEDFKKLLRKRYRVDQCRDYLAKCYRDLGVHAYGHKEFDQAQEYWDQALKYTRDPHLRRMLYTNKAGAYEADKEYGSAEAVVRKQIEDEPGVANHWKNLGLILGYEGRAREALVAYGRTRELSEAAKTPFFLGVLHGNAWLRAAMVHGKVLPDGDPVQAWKLLLQYRAMLGDDYNFSLAFGEFALELDALAVAERFFQNARSLVPHCVQPYQRLLDVASRWPDPKERKAKRDHARKEFQEARKRSKGTDESHQVRRLCGGTADYGDVTTPKRSDILEPDPLAGFDEQHPPEWVLEAARTREPFRPYDPAVDGRGARFTTAVPPQPAPQADASAPVQAPAWMLYVAGAAVLGALAFVLLRGRRSRAAA